MWGGLGVPAGEPAARSMWKEEGVSWAFFSSFPSEGAARGAQLSEQQLACEEEGVCVCA